MLAHTFLRQPGRVVPGWFPLVVERARGVLPPPASPVVAVVNGSRMRLDLDDYVQRKIWYRSFEPGEVRRLGRLMRPGDVALDVGANVGFFTLLLAALVGPSGAVHAFEPVPQNADALAENVELNGYRNVTLNRVGVGATTGTLELGLPPGDDSSGSWRRGAPGAAIAVPMVTIDGYVAEHVPGPIRLVKIDVEGMEDDVLAGMRRTLESGRPDALLVEISGDEAISEVRAIQGPLRGYGYRLRRVGILGGLHEPRQGGLQAHFGGLYNVLAVRA